MAQQTQCPASRLVTPSEEMSRELQRFDRFVVFPPSPTQNIRFPVDELNFEPTVVNTHAWNKQQLQERQNRNQVQHRDLDLFMNESPITSNSHNRVLPTYVALMMTKDNYQRSPSIPLSASCQSVQKRCLFPDCTKMSVSKGLCRGHGGGRRCHFAGGCTKSAQSRSMFCWAHGGGQRCDVDTCMRSRKTKHFCVAHMHLETENSHSPSSDKNSGVPRTRRSRYVPVPTRIHRQSSQRILPSLGQALSAASLSLPSFPILAQVRTRCLDE